MNEQIIKAWKDPALRESMGVSHPSGQAFTEMSLDEMVNIQGAGDVEPMSTPTITISSWGCSVTIGIGISKLTC